MFTSIQKWLQIIVCIISTQLLSISLFAQPKNLEAEVDINSGFATNQVRVVEKCRDKSIWVGTDDGLVILNDHDSVYSSLIKSVGNAAVFALAFYHDAAIVGTRFNGIYIFDLDQQKIIKYYDTLTVGLCRRFKIIHDTVFIATKSNPYHLTYRNAKWKLTKIETDVKDGFISDFSLFEKNIFASVYTSGNYHLRIFKNGKFLLPSPNEYWFKNVITQSSLALYSNDSVLLVGGNGYYSEVGPGKKLKRIKLSLPLNFQPLPIWDVVEIEKRNFFGIGNPNDLKQGMIFSPTSSLNEINPDFYSQCLNYDSYKKALWMGTMNRGLFYWPFVSNSFNVSSIFKNEYKYKVISQDSLLLHDDRKVILYDLKNNTAKNIYQKGLKENISRVSDLAFRNDTIIILDAPKVITIDLKSNKRSYLPLPEPVNIDKFRKLYVKGNDIYSFAIYEDGIGQTNLKNGKISLLPYPAIQPQFIPYRNNILYHSSPKGFIYFDGKIFPFDISAPFVESFTVLHDTLYTLYSSTLKTYKLDFDQLHGKLLNEINLKSLIPGFNPSTIFEISGKIFCIDKQGIILWNPQKNSPEKYLYMGNYKEAKRPVPFKNYLYFNYDNYITRVDPGNSFPEIVNNEWRIFTEPGNNVFEGTPLEIKFYSRDHILQNHSLKKIEIFQGDKTIDVIYSIGSNIHLPQNLAKGNYKIKCHVNNQLIFENEIKITVPLTSNPLFYIAISLFLILLIVLIAKYIIDKRAHERQILLNRLQLLKQNLNPHFIFNSLNLIYSLVLQNKNKTAVETITHFSDLHRYYLENINKSRISLKEELAFIDSYLKIESGRVQLDDAFNFSIPQNLIKEEANFQVPPMILQPLVENAVKYSSSDHGIREIWVDLTLKENKLIIGIENTLETIYLKNTHGNRLGLHLVQERIDIHNKSYQEKIEFLVQVPCLHTVIGYRCELIFS